MKLKFLEDAYYNGKRKYLLGETYEISDELGEATRWLKRGKAEEVKEVEKAIKEEVVVIEEQLEEVVSVKEEPIVKEVLQRDNGKHKKRGNRI